MKDIIGHIRWVELFDAGLKEYREAETDEAKARAAAKLHELGLTDGDVLYFANKTPRR